MTVVNYPVDRKSAYKAFIYNDTTENAFVGGDNLPDWAQWAQWANDHTTQKLQESLNSYVIATRTNGSTIVTYVGKSTGNKHGKLEFTNTTIPANQYDISPIEVAYVNDVYNPDTEKWKEISFDRINADVKTDDYVMVVFRFQDVIKTVQGNLVDISNSTVTLKGDGHDETFNMWLNVNQVHVYKSKANKTI